MSHHVSSADRAIAFQCLFAQQLFWCFSTAMIRISVALSLLRLSTSRVWKWSLYTMIAVQIITYLGFLILLFGQVSPMQTNWKQVPYARRWNGKYQTTYSWVANRKFYMASASSAQLRRTSHHYFIRCCPSAHANPTYPDSPPNTP